MAAFKSDLEWAKWFKAEFGICPMQLKRELEQNERKNNADFDRMIFEKTGHPNGYHPNAYKNMQLDWAKIEECEDDGYDWPTMPWLPPRWERKGKSYFELNKLAYERKQQYTVDNK